MSNVAEVTFTRKFSAAHRIASDPGVCQRIHGHNYRVEITVRRMIAGEGGKVVSGDGFVIPADMIKEQVDRKYDHKLILDVDDPVGQNFGGDWIVETPGPPSTENLARWICDDVTRLMSYVGGTLCTVTVILHETDTISAKAEAQT